MIIGVDLDDVLAEFHETFIAFCNARYGTRFKKEDFTDSDINKTWGISHEEIVRRVSQFDIAESKRRIPPRAGAKEMIAKMARQHSLHVITNRPIEIREHTLKWVDQHFPGMFSDAHFCTKNNGKTLVYSKGVVCKRIGAPILLEDHLFNVQRCAADGIHIYLFDQPWNRQELPLMAGAIIRVQNWHDQILETLLGECP